VAGKCKHNFERDAAKRRDIKYIKSPSTGTERAARADVSELATCGAT